MADVLSAARFIFSKLSTYPGLSAIVGDRIFEDVGPLDAGYPRIVFSSQGSRDVMVINRTSIMLDEMYSVRVIGQTGSYISLESAYNLVHNALQRASMIVTGGQVLSCSREYPLKFGEVIDGVDYKHLGGVYRIYSK